MTFKANANFINCLDISKDENIIISVGGDEKVCMTNVSKKKNIYTN